MATGKKKTPSVPPAQLKQWAAQAARLHVDENVPLSDAVIRVLQGKEVSIAHIKRVCEEANNQAFNILFNRGRENRSVTFVGGPADPAIVIRELKDGFAAAPAQEAAMKTASMDLRGEVPQTTFDNLVKQASLQLDHGLVESVKMWKRAALSAELAFHETITKLASLVRQEVARGVGRSKVAAAIERAVGTGPEGQVVVDQLREKVAFMRDAKAADLQHPVNMQHPLVKTAARAAALAKLYVQFAKTAELAEQQKSLLGL